MKSLIFYSLLTMAKTNNNASKASTANKTTKGIAVKKKRTAGKKQDGETPKQARPYFVVCVGASAGGLSAIREFIAQVPADLNAAVFIVWHLSRTALGDVFTERIRKDAKMLCKQPEDNETIRSGTTYLAIPDAHLLIKKDTILIGHGPAENRFRPSIDVLFRSAAASYGDRVIGVVLTGLLNDGTAGMMTIRESGGHCLVQDPNEAEYPGMPLSVLQTMEVDHVLPLKKMGEAIENIVKNVPLKGTQAPSKVVAESRISEKVATSIDKVAQLGEKSLFSCPDCGGALWKINNGHVAHYRCHIGHSYSEEDLGVKQYEGIEHTLWVAVRMMEERKINFRKLEKEARDKGLERLANTYAKHDSQLEDHIEQLKELLFALQKD